MGEVKRQATDDSDLYSSNQEEDYNPFITVDSETIEDALKNNAIDNLLKDGRYEVFAFLQENDSAILGNHLVEVYTGGDRDDFTETILDFFGDNIELFTVGQTLRGVSSGAEFTLKSVEKEIKSVKSEESYVPVEIVNYTLELGFPAEDLELIIRTLSEVITNDDGSIEYELYDGHNFCKDGDDLVSAYDVIEETEYSEEFLGDLHDVFRPVEEEK